MKYDFETLVNRNHTGAVKWELMRAEMPELEDTIVPFSIADMDFKPAPELVAGLKAYLDEAVFGYVGATSAYYDAVIRYMQRHHGYAPKREWIVTFPGVVSALKQIVTDFTSPQDGVMILRPVYPPFIQAVEEKGRTLVVSELVKKGDSYEIDFEDLEKKAAQPEVKLLIFCSPHNPVGRVWTRDELVRVFDICLKHQVLVVCDEVHCDIVMPGYQHISAGAMEEKYRNNCIICTAPSKTFNIAGFQVANLIVSNEEYRSKLEQAVAGRSLNIMSYKACEIVYNSCEDWREEMLTCIYENYQAVKQFIEERLPMIQVTQMQGTYLMWLDCRALGMSAKELEQFMKQKAHIFFDEGTMFGESGSGYERLSLACPRWVLLEAMERLEKAVKSIGKDEKIQSGGTA